MDGLPPDPEPPPRVTKVTLAEKRRLAFSMARAAGADLVRLGPAKPQAEVVVLAWGSGLFMATADHLLARYPHLAILGADLPLGLGVENRACIIDWLGTVWKLYLVIWAAGIPSVEYLHALERRRFKVPVEGWIYLQPIPPVLERFAWAQLGFVRVWDPWSAEPLGLLY